MKNIIRQNKKDGLLEFLFGKDENNKSLLEDSSTTFQEMDHKIQNLQNQINSLQQKVIHLETNLENSNYALIGNIDAPDTIKSIQLGDSTSKYEKGLYSAENDSKRSEVRNPTYPRNFITSEDTKVVDVWQSPGKISEEEQIEIIKTGFQRQTEGILSLKKYYEGTGEYSLFQLKCVVDG